MPPLTQIAQALNEIADETWTTPHDVLKAATERGDAFERVAEELDAHKRRAESDAQQCADVLTAAQRLKEATDARVAAFKASIADVVEGRCRAIEGEYDALIRAKGDEYDAPIAATLAEVQALRNEKMRKVAELRCFVHAGNFKAGQGLSSFTPTCTLHLKQWTDTQNARVIYDSAVDEFTEDGLFEKVKGKENIALVGLTTEGDVFGGFYSVAVDSQDGEFNDPSIFAFSFESHGRCMTPQRFAVNEKLRKDAGVTFYKGWPAGFVLFWAGCFASGFCLGNERSESFCDEVSFVFEGLENTTLTGNFIPRFDRTGPRYHCARLVAVQLS